MPLPIPSRAPVENPLAPLGHIVHSLTQTGGKVAVGLVIGAVLTRLMRARHLHWSWAAIVLAVVLLARDALAGHALTTGVAALVATLRGRRWHREDLEAGADLAEVAAARHSPRDALSPLAVRAWTRLTSARRDSGSHGEELVIGQGTNGGTVSMPLGGVSGGTHALLVGATGSGKTVTQTWITERAIERGMAAVVIDPKGDDAMRTGARRAAEDAARRFVEWTPNGPSIYNPFAQGSETEIADKLLAGERFTEPHYLRQAQRFLGHVVRALRSAEVEVSLRQVVAHCDVSGLEMLARRLPDSVAGQTYAYLDSLSTRQTSELTGVRDRLAVLTESDVGPWLDPDSCGTQRFDLLQAVREQAVVYFDLAADSRPLLTQMLGAAIVQDLQTTVAALQGQAIPTLVVIDEFSSIAAEHVVRLFGRARSAGFSLVLSTQELADLRLPGHEMLLERILGNLSVLIAHRQVVPDSAALISALAGTRGVWRTSRHGDGRLTRTRSRESVLAAHDVATLGTGRAALIALSDGGRARIMQVFSPPGIRHEGRLP